MEWTPNQLAQQPATLLNIHNATASIESLRLLVLNLMERIEVLERAAGMPPRGLGKQL